MDIHEYQAKELLAKFGVRVPRGAVSYSPEQAAYRAREIGGSQWAIKATVGVPLSHHGVTPLFLFSEMRGHLCIMDI